MSFEEAIKTWPEDEALAFAKNFSISLAGSQPVNASARRSVAGRLSVASSGGRAILSMASTNAVIGLVNQSYIDLMKSYIVKRLDSEGVPATWDFDEKHTKVVKKGAEWAMLGSVFSVGQIQHIVVFYENLSGVLVVFCGDVKLGEYSKDGKHHSFSVSGLIDCLLGA